MRILFVALFMVLSTRVSAQEANGGHHQEREWDRSVNNGHAQIEIPSSPIKGAGGDKRPAERSDQDGEKDKTGENKIWNIAGDWSIVFDPKDTYAQWVMAVLSVVATCASIAAVIMVGRSLGLTRDATEAAVTTNKQSLAIFVAENRPWLCVESIEISNWEDTDNGGDYISPAVKVKNIGRTPALNVKLDIVFWRGGFPLTGTKAIEEFASAVDQYKWGNIGVFSERETTVHANERDDGDRRAFNYLLVCISYRSTAIQAGNIIAETIFQTACAVELDRGNRVKDDSFYIT